MCTQKEHEQIFNATIARDSKRATKLLAGHVTRTFKAIHALFIECRFAGTRTAGQWSDRTASTADLSGAPSLRSFSQA